MLTTRSFRKIALNNTKLFSTLIKKKESVSDKTWTKVVLKNKKDGSLTRLRVEDFSIDLFDKLWELNMNYFMKEEFLLKISGINEDAEAMQEYKDVLLESFKNPAHNTRIYMIDDDFNSNTEIVAVSMMKLITSKDDVDYIVQATTKPLRKYIDILTTINKLFSIEDMMKMYNVDCYYEDVGIVVHPKYRMLGISYYEELARRLLCKDHNVPLMTAWCTTLGGQKITQNSNWDTVFEISYEKLGSLLDVNFKDAPPICKYMAAKVD